MGLIINDIDMEMSDENKYLHRDGSGNSFLSENPNKEGVSKSHQSYLGLTIPPDYFSKSKNDILNSVIGPEIREKKSKISFNSRYFWPVAATVAILIGFGFFLLIQNTTLKTHSTRTENHQANKIDLNSQADDAFISFLFIDDSELDSYVDEYFINTIFSEVFSPDYNPGSVIINSLRSKNRIDSTNDKQINNDKNKDR